MEPGSRPNRAPQHHGCLLAYLIFAILANALMTLLYTFAVFFGDIRPPARLPELFYILIPGGLINVMFAVALLFWKKWAFYGICVMAVGMFCLNVYVGANLMGAFAGLLAPALLFVLLQLGGDNKGWNNLK